MKPAVIGIWGAPGTIKSTLAATWPMGIGWHEFDIGGFDRGSKYLDEEQLAGITLHAYPIPVKLEMTKDTHMLEGWAELWQSFLTNIKADLANPAIKTLVYDTGTLAWQACHRAYLQVAQRKNANRESLIQMEYGDVNPWMYAVLQAPRTAGKHLVVTFHDAPYYVDDGKGGTKEDPSGAVHHAGFSHFPKIADLMLHTMVEDMVPYAIIEDHSNKKIKDVKTGMAPLELVRMRIANPTYQAVDTLLDAAAAIRAASMPMPDDAASIIAMGGMLSGAA